MEVKNKKGRIERAAKVDLIVDKIKDADALVVNDYRGLTVGQISLLRREIASLGASLHVQKNKLVKIAMSNEGYPEELNNLMVGPTAVAYVKGDVSPVLKALFKYAKDEGYSFDVKGAYADGVVLDRTSAEKVSSLPSREQLIYQLMGMMNAPVRDLVLSINDVIVRVVRALQSVADNTQ